MFWGMQHQAKNDLLQRLDAHDYVEQEVVELRIPLTLPYPLHPRGFQRLDGEFQYQGESYELVKQKLENDTLFLVCIKDVESARIASVLFDYATIANDLPTGAKQALTFLGKLQKDFNTSEFVYFVESRYLFEQTYYTDLKFDLVKQYYPVDSPPPELLS